MSGYAFFFTYHLTISHSLCSASLSLLGLKLVSWNMETDVSFLLCAESGREVIETERECLWRCRVGRAGQRLVLRHIVSHLPSSIFIPSSFRPSLYICGVHSSGMVAYLLFLLVWWSFFFQLGAVSYFNFSWEHSETIVVHHSYYFCFFEVEFVGGVCSVTC